MGFKKWRLILACLLLAGCGLGGGNYMKKATKIVNPTSDRAVVVFLRTTAYGLAAVGAVYDVTEEGESKFIGLVPAKNKISYSVLPGEKLFMIVSEGRADFLHADVRAGKTYYANAIPRWGGFTLYPVRVDRDLSIEKIKKWIDSCNPIENTEKSFEWAKKRKKQTKIIKEKYLKKWNARPRAERQSLNVEDGF